MRRQADDLSLPPAGNLGMFTIGDVPEAEGIDVPLRRLDAVLAESGVTHADLFKVDIEGAEFAALGTAGAASRADA